MLISTPNDPGLETGCEDVEVWIGTARHGAKVKQCRALWGVGAQGRESPLPLPYPHPGSPSTSQGMGTGNLMSNHLECLEITWRWVSCVCKSRGDAVSPLQVTASSPALHCGTAWSCLLDVGAFWEITTPTGAGLN